MADIPKKPRSFVVDEPAQFSSGQKSKLESAMAKMSAAPTYIVNKKGRLPVSANLYANELLRRWSSSGTNFSAMVLSVDTPLPEIFVVISGRNLDPGTRNDLLTLGNAAIKLIDGQSGQFKDIQKIATAIAPALNTFAQLYQKPGIPPSFDTNEINQLTDLPANAPLTGRQPFPRDRSSKASSQWDLLSSTLDWRLIHILFIITCATVFLAGIALLFRRIRRHRPLYFPVHKPRHRFSAPYSGGSNAQIKYVSE
ncbi:MAG: hypothetical protein GY899_16340 [Verrucomicrobiaceae bacterium]|nr:hypothetical protein [Verrucomicrobiaceae bacterium]